MNNNLLLNTYNITNFNKFIEILDNIQCEANEIIIELFKEYLTKYNIIVFNDTIISNFKRILYHLFTYNFIDLFKRYNLYINHLNIIINNLNNSNNIENKNINENNEKINDIEKINEDEKINKKEKNKNKNKEIKKIDNNERQILDKIINNKFREEDLKFFINYNFMYNDINYAINIILIQKFYANLYELFNYEEINYIIENLNKIRNKYQKDIKTLYNKLIKSFNIYYKNINTKKYYDKLIKYLSTNNLNLKFFLLYDIIKYIIDNFYNE